MPGLYEILAIFALVAGLWWWTHRTPKPVTAAQRRARLHRQMLSMNMNDEGVVRRLVEYERERNPSLTDTGCYRAAIGRMRR